MKQDNSRTLFKYIPYGTARCTLPAEVVIEQSYAVAVAAAHKGMHEKAAPRRVPVFHLFPAVGQ